MRVGNNGFPVRWSNLAGPYIYPLESAIAVVPQTLIRSLTLDSY
jgi:hypothetical protein